MKNLKKIVSVLFSAILLFSATISNSVAIDKLHFVIVVVLVVVGMELLEVLERL